ncbi:Uncharacterised protein [Streptococcus acidominimus]|uniref:Uncharacterized protein n=1 Tax=Streptococcus acidominimus TaxID=1326 RepID=A0A239X0A8_STRAI|nr:HTH domain-containing protein [Streptococcus acidominimus]SNV39830.1 Uncharacterised protein [Streptococcus acidominimus]
MITDKVIDLLKNTDLTQLQIANQTGITPAKVAQINQEAGIRDVFKMRKWSETEVTYLIKYAGKLSAGEIAEELDRTEQSVLNKIAALGLSAKVNRVKKAKKRDVVKPHVSPERDKIKIDISAYISKPT